MGGLGDHRVDRARLLPGRAGHRRPTPSASALLVLFLFVGMGARRLPRRLHQDLQAAQPRACAARRRWSARRWSRWSSASWPFADARGRPPRQPGLARTSPSSATSRARPARARGDPAVLGDGHRHQQRGEPHRRPRRAGHRRLRDGVRRLHARQHLAEQPELRDPARRRPATRCATRSTSRWWRRPSPAPASASCGGTRHPAKIFMGDTGSLVPRRRAGRAWRS